MTPASAFQQSLSEVKSSTIFRRSSSTHHGPRSSSGDRSRSFTTLEPLSKPAIAHHGGDPVFRSQPPHHSEDLRAKIFRRTSAWRQRSLFRAILDVTHRGHDVVITFRRSASCRHGITSRDLRLLGDVFRVMPHSGRVRAHLSTPTIRARCAPILFYSAANGENK